MRRSAITLETEMTESESRALVETAGLADPSAKYLEIGTAAGGALKLMMLRFEAPTRPVFVVVDPLTYFENQKAKIDTNLRGAGLDPAAVDFRVGFSSDKLPAAIASGERFSFILIDANHKARFVMEDLAWTRMLNVGGYVCLHDHKPNCPGVIWSTARFLRRNPNYRLVRVVDSLAILQKTGPSRAPEVSNWDIGLAALVSPVLRFGRSIRRRLRGRPNRSHLLPSS